ncbi:MAG: aldehyde oxidase and xanthine dehydrogenase molybdopterin binding protein [Actinomycetia bacterium]|nr:aldehyde oxidase and xanthine dehydrogenase molybdopterin binding protein [Actinomycetes bacterium]
MGVVSPAIGAPVDRIEGGDKVRGEATYAYEYEVERVAYAAILQSTIARGTVRSIDAADALALPGVIAMLTHENAPKLQTDDGELSILQSPAVAYRGQIAGAVIADSEEAARDAARLVRFTYEEEKHDVELRYDHPGLYKPDKINANFDTDSTAGDFDAAFGSADVTVDETYTTPAFHNNPIEPHATIAVWEGGDLTLYDSNQGAYAVQQTVAGAFGMQPERVRVISRHVGGAFGSKGTPRPHLILAVMAAQLVERPVKLAVTRQQMFSLTGYRTPTIQRLRLGAGADGRLTAIAHEVVEQCSTVKEFAEQTAVATRMMYAAANRRTTHRVVRLDVPTPAWMRAPGECPGMYALESAMDELAIACKLDPIELRVRNEPDVDPETGQRFSSRNLVACLREGAERFGWNAREAGRDGRWLIGAGVASSTYPARLTPSTAHARAESDGTFTIRITASDIGTGARTALTQIAADTLDVPLERVHVEIGDSDFGQAMLAGGSIGTASWGSAVVKACRALRAGQDEATVDTSDDVNSYEPLAKHAFGAQFVEVNVNVDTGEIRVPRALGVFACGRIVNPKTARSQFIGGMTMGISMALLEESVIDPRFGDFVNHDLASYHVASCADVREIEAIWIDEEDPHLNPMGTKGIGEIGIVGTAAAVANAVHHATGIRIRDLPIRPDKLLSRLPSGGS